MRNYLTLAATLVVLVSVNSFVLADVRHNENLGNGAYQICDPVSNEYDYYTLQYTHKQCCRKVYAPVDSGKAEVDLGCETWTSGHEEH